MRGHQYTDEEMDWLREHVRLMSYAELTPLFNARFGCDLKAEAIAQHCFRRGLSTGRDGRFAKGHATWNKGRKGLDIGGKKTRFKPGNRPPLWVPVGTEGCRNQDGYLMVKVAEPNVWRYRHRLVWEAHNGPIPKGCAVIFADGDRRNFDPENLLLVTRAELGRINKQRLIKPDADLTKAGMALVKLQRKIDERLKEAKP